MEETLDSVNEDDELEAEADEEVEKVLYELTDGKLGQAGRVGGELPVSPRRVLLRRERRTWLTCRRRKWTKMRTRQKRNGCGKKWRNCSVHNLAGRLRRWVEHVLPSCTFRHM